MLAALGLPLPPDPVNDTLGLPLPPPPVKATLIVPKSIPSSAVFDPVTTPTVPDLPSPSPIVLVLISWL